MKCTGKDYDNQFNLWLYSLINLSYLKFFFLNIYSSNAECQKKMLVAGSVGPYGACQHDGSEYTGKYVDNMTIQVGKQDLKDLR